MSRKEKKVALVLGSGGARGWAHLGVLRALDEIGFKPDILVGSSAGAMVGAFHVAGRIRDLYELARQLKWKDVLYYFSDVSRSGVGLVDGRKIEEVFRGVLGHLTIQELPIPFAAIATDVERGREVVLKKGDLVEAIRASISIPGIFSPVARDGVMLVDGGLIDPVPVLVAREMGADVVVAVNALGVLPPRVSMEVPKRPAAAARPSRPSLPEIWKAGNDGSSFVENVKRTLASVDLRQTVKNRPWLKKGRRLHLFDVLATSIRIMEIQIAETTLSRDKPDILITPALSQIGILEFQSMEEAERAGYEATRAMAGHIRKLVVPA